MDSRIILAGAIVFATIVAAWMLRYEYIPQSLGDHRNRFTGAVCHYTEECWFVSRR